MKLALFGGSFDPIHNAHLLIAARAREKLKLDQVLFIPCRKSPHKPGSRPTSAADRLAMVRSATRKFSWAQVSDIEVKRQGLSYSIDTVQAIEETYKGSRLFWLMGSDQWKVLEDWRQYKQLAEKVEFIVYPRPNLPAVKKGIRAHFMDFRYDLSASEIRNRVKLGLEVSMMLPPSVERMTRIRGLYKKSGKVGR